MQPKQRPASEERRKAHGRVVKPFEFGDSPEVTEPNTRAAEGRVQERGKGYVGEQLVSGGKVTGGPEG